jgi:cytochrome c oxidase subunit 2
LLSAIRMSSLVLVAGLVLVTSLAASAYQPGQNPQVIEVTAKKYDFTPSPIRVKQGARVQLKITATDREHGIKFDLYPDGAKSTGPPGLVMASPQDCFKLEKGTATTVEFTAQTPGTYSFKCCVSCGMGHGRMKGQLIVEP